jgi:competence protein ComEC
MSASTEIPPDEKEPQEVLGGLFEIHFIDVGYGDAALVICDGKTMLIDAGSSGKLISAYLTKQNITYLDYAVATHAHSDHVGGLAGALTTADVGVVLSTVAESEDNSFQKFADKVAERGRTITVPTAGDTFALGGATITVLGPVPRKEYEDINDTSLVLRIVYGEISVLFTADIKSAAETDLLNSGVDLSATLLKVPHHGKASPASEAFLDAVAPAYAVISVGTIQPSAKVLSRLREHQAKCYRTDLQGDIICRSNGKELFFQTAKVGEENQSN